MHPIRSQSAMEYLMTYGWSILIIAVVVVAIWQLGVFNASNFAPRAQPGSCKVVRQQVFGGGYQINLLGVCNELPQFVAYFSGNKNYVTVPNNPNIEFTNAFTVVGWVQAPTLTSPSAYGRFITKGTNGDREWDIFRNKPGGSPANTIELEVVSSGGTSYSLAANAPMQINIWYFVAVVVSGGTNAYLYINGMLNNSRTLPGITIKQTTNSLGIGGWGDATGDYWQGSIADIQIYNTSLDASAIQSLYAEGIGGAPIPSQYLVGWWPLNGDAQDYGGNNNNGAPTNVIFTSTWTK